MLKICKNYLILLILGFLVQLIISSCNKEESLWDKYYLREQDSNKVQIMSASFDENNNLITIVRNNEYNEYSLFNFSANGYQYTIGNTILQPPFVFNSNGTYYSSFSDGFVRIRNIRNNCIASTENGQML